MKNKKLSFSRPFEKAFERLPQDIREAAYDKLVLFLDNPKHPSLRVKRMKGTDAIWEMSITMNYLLTFEIHSDEIFLRKIGTHNILSSP